MRLGGLERLGAHHIRAAAEKQRRGCGPTTKPFERRESRLGSPELRIDRACIDMAGEAHPFRGACADTLGECMPRMGMRVDETGQDDAALSVDDSKVRPTWGCSLPDGHDAVAMDDDMPRLQDPALGVHGKQYGVLDGQPLGQSPLLWVRGRYPSHILYTKFAARTSGSHRDFPPDFASFGDIITFALAEPLESRYRRVSNSLIELYAILRSRASTEARKRDEARSSDDPGGPGPFGERAG